MQVFVRKFTVYYRIRTVLQVQLSKVNLKEPNYDELVIKQE